MKAKTAPRAVAVAWAIVVGFALGLAAGAAEAAAIIVKTVPWVASNPLVPHVTYSGKAVTLKGTAGAQGATIQYAWDFGDGSPVATGTVTDRYVIQATHAYVGATGTVFTARLTVTNTATGDTGNKAYYVQLGPHQLSVEADIAIDEGLWYLHKTQRRFTSGVDLGDWTACSSYGCNAASGYYGVSAANVNAFEVNGHLENGPADDPYTETVARGMRQLFAFVAAGSIPSSQGNGIGTFNPDTNGNGLGIGVNQSYQFYQGGMFIDAIVASGTPAAIATTGPANVVGRSYAAIVQDMVDYYMYCQYDFGGGGGWRYNCQDFPDNSAAQWGAIGLIAAERQFGSTIPSIVKSWNRYWLNYSQAADGSFGYTQAGYFPWGPYATTASGMVQMAMDGIGRGTVAPPPAVSWDKAETYIRNNFGNGGGPTTSIKAYYYGLFSFTKAMLLHDSNGDGVAEPITMLQSSTPGVPPIDWYAAEAAKGDPTDGVARTLINQQTSVPGADAGSWFGHNYDGNQYRFETAWAIMMLNRTVFSSGVPVAVAKATPNPGVAGQLITFDGTDSFHQDPTKSIVSWQWDLNNDGVFDATGPFASRSFPAVNSYPVRLRVCDNGVPVACADTTVTVLITTPPVPPTANAGGPYSFCPAATPWFLDGRGSVNPDDGLSEPGRPGDKIQSYAWDLNGDNNFNDASGPTPDVTAYFTARGVGLYIVQLKVTDTTSLSFPSSGLGDLSDTASAAVTVRAATDPVCTCISDLSARPKATKVQLVWTPAAGVNHYNVYRGTVSGGPYLKIGQTASTYATYLDSAVVINTTYYYVVREADAADRELCQSNQAVAKPQPR